MSAKEYEQLTSEEVNQAKTLIAKNSQPVPFSGCWIWLRGGCGYGRTRLPNIKKLWLAHRLSFMAYKGRLGIASLVLHSCDTPMCVNPEHLRQGTQADNMQDKVLRGRWYAGKGARKLNVSQVEDIRRRFASGQRPMEIARQLNLKWRNVYNICNGEAWKA